MILQPIHIFALASVAGAVRTDQISMTIMASGIIDEPNVPYADTSIPFNNSTALESYDSYRKRRNALIPKRSSASFLNLSNYSPDFGKGSYERGKYSYDGGKLSYDYGGRSFSCILGKKLGHGSYGSVHECAAGQEKLAIKFITDPELAKASRDEFAMQQKIHSKHVVEAKAAFLMKPGPKIPQGALCIVMELVPHELFNLLRLFQGDIDRTTRIWLQVLEGVTAVHRAGLMWRDLKPENILCTTSDPDTMVVKITDFGFAVEMGMQKKLKGTPEYLAPEQVKGQPYDESVDSWALGILYYELYYGAPPFTRRMGIKTMYQKILRSTVRFTDEFGRVPKDMKAFVSRCLAKNPEERLRVLDSDPNKQMSSQPWVEQWKMAQWLKANRFGGVDYRRSGGHDGKWLTLDRKCPLHAAVKEGNLEMVKMLIKYKSSTTCVDDKNRTPKQLADSYGKAEISALLA